MKHWNDDELIAALYDVGPEDGHVAECAECATRLARLRHERLVHAQPPSVADEVFAAQRREVLARVKRPASLSRRWAPVVALAGLVIAGFLVFRPQPGPQVSDSQFFAEIAAVEEATPRVAAPISALFEDPKK